MMGNSHIVHMYIHIYIYNVPEKSDQAKSIQVGELNVHLKKTTNKKITISKTQSE